MHDQYYLAWQYVTFHHITTQYIAFNYMTLHDIAYRNLTLYHFISHASIAHPILLRHDSSYDVTHSLQYITSRCVALRVVAVHYIIWCYVARNYATLLHRVASRSHHINLHYLTLDWLGLAGDWPGDWQGGWQGSTG